MPEAKVLVMELVEAPTLAESTSKGAGFRWCCSDRLNAPRLSVVTVQSARNSV